MDWKDYYLLSVYFLWALSHKLPKIFSGEYPNGKTLVVCCEGNAGFYELGIMTVPLDAGYSVLGWNHPGFGGSTVCYKDYFTSWCH